MVINLKSKTHVSMVVEAYTMHNAYRQPAYSDLIALMHNLRSSLLSRPLHPSRSLTASGSRLLSLSTCLYTHR